MRKKLKTLEMMTPSIPGKGKKLYNFKTIKTEKILKGSLYSLYKSQLNGWLISLGLNTVVHEMSFLPIYHVAKKHVSHGETSIRLVVVTLDKVNATLQLWFVIFKTNQCLKIQCILSFNIFINRF